MTATSIHYLHAVAHSPEGHVHGEVSGRTDVRFWCEPDHFARTPIDAVVAELESLLPQLYRARMRAFYELRSRQEGRVVRPPHERLRRRSEDYEARIAGIHAWGESAGVSMSALGMRTFEVRADDAARQLDEHSFCLAAGRAATALIVDQFAQVLDLKYEMAGR
ncbi:hypothetical protein ABFT23_18955 [Nocardioides sp. C4-1]|uniref:hypothetical protein n=1 Tax=Nocardioides sp. C4-1 TaxID=3151851 RepID=UPI0032671318